MCINLCGMLIHRSRVNGSLSIEKSQTLIKVGRILIYKWVEHVPVLEDKNGCLVPKAWSCWFYENSLIGNYARNNSSSSDYELLLMLVRFCHSYGRGTEAVDHGSYH